VKKPTDLDDLEDQADGLFDLLDQVEADAKTWEAALGDFNQGNLDRFIAARPAWRDRLEERALRGLDSAGLRSTAIALLADLEQYMMLDPARLAEANRLMAALGTADEIGYRSEIRVAALMRIRFVMTTVAGRVWLRSKKEQSKAFEALDRCEDLALPIKPPPPRVTEPSRTSAFPALQEDRRRAAGIRPGWLGITFVPVGRGRRKSLTVPEGAAQVTSIAARSPAATAGLRSGDIVTGAPGQPFSHRSDLRPFIVAAAPGSPLPLEVLRGRNHVVVRPTVGAAPIGAKR